MMLCVAINGPTFEAAYQQISMALPMAEMVELRLDHFQSLDRDGLKKLRSQFSIPMIFTLRSREHGGAYSPSEEARILEIRRLATLKPEYLDLEAHLPKAFIEEIASLHPSIKLILSYHNFSETPRDLDAIFKEMKKRAAHFYKVAVMANNSLDALRLLCWAKQQEAHLIAVSMGRFGQVSRILGKIFGFPITYAALNEDEKSAPGQLTAKVLTEQYHHPSHNPETRIYGLIGNPVDLSISDKTHNSKMGELGVNAIYVKLPVTGPELAPFLELAKQIPFQGLSVTMPLKEEILPLVDEIDREALNIGAVNTLLFKGGKIIGFNTDGVGALDALEKISPVKKRRIVILGAGGAAKAISYEAIRRGGDVILLNRNKERALQIANQLLCEADGLEAMKSQFEKGYDILINCTPTLPISPDYLIPEAIVMDIVSQPRETPLLIEAKKKGCSVIYGYEMFIEQALGQFSLWRL